MRSYPRSLALGAATPSANLDARTLPFLPMQIRKDAAELNLFTSIATTGTPHDVIARELKIESFFPADEATERRFRERAALQVIRRVSPESITENCGRGLDRNA